MNTLQTNYQALVTEENEVPHESVIFHAASEGGKSQWNHIGDLDTFFKNVYEYHQKHGFMCIMLAELKRTIIPLLIIFGFAYIINGVNFSFDNPSSSSFVNKTDISLNDLFLSIPEASHYFGLFSWLIVIFGILTMFYKFYKLWQTYSTFDDIRHFYSSAMKLDENKVNHMTWHEIQCRLREVQHEQQMCVHKSDLTELDISHRILRQKNYLVAMVNKNILPVKFKFMGEWVYMPSAYEYVLYLLFFSHFSPVFKETGKVSEDIKKYAKRKEAAAKLERFIDIVTVLSSLIAVPYILYYLCSAFLKHAADMKCYPVRLFNRQWSTLAHFYFRHFNELDHELDARLARAYKPANEYMKAFSNPVTVILAGTVSKIFGAVAVYFLIWGLALERLFTINGVLILMSACYVIYLILSALIPEENVVYFPKRLMKKIIAEIHYVPDHFKANAHLPAVRDEFSHFFQIKSVAIVQEAFSMLLLPFVLRYRVRPRALDFVDFFRNFTVEVSGVGDVCSFALMDVSRHGNNQWQTGVHTKADQTHRAEGGKTELSLIHFTLMNPDWKPPPSSDVFVHDFRERVNVAREAQDTEDPYFTSLNSLSSMGSKYASLVNSIHFSRYHPTEYPREHYVIHAPDETEEIEAMSGGVSLTEGPRYLGQGGYLSSRYGELAISEVQADPSGLNPLEIRAADMSFSALYLHEVHKRLIESSSSSQVIHQRQPSQESADQGNEASPLLEVGMTNYVQ